MCIIVIVVMYVCKGGRVYAHGVLQRYRCVGVQVFVWGYSLGVLKWGILFVGVLMMVDRWCR